MPDVYATVQSRAVALEDFRGDFGDVTTLIQTAWAENGQQPLLYTPEFLASCFEYPGTDRALAPTIYEGDKPLAFIAGFPRRVRYKGRELRLIVSSFLSVVAEHKKKGYGVVLWSELAKRAQAAGFDGMVSYCVDGEPMNDIILGCCRMLKLPTAHLFTVCYQMRILPSTNHFSREDATLKTSENVRLLLELAHAVKRRAELARIWTEKEAEWQCQRCGVIAAKRSSETRSGIITGCIMEIANAQRTKCLLIEDMLWGTLDAQERQDMLQELLHKAVAVGAQIAITPCLNYADMEPLRAARFRRSARTLHAYLTIFAGDPAPREVSSMYLDVF